MGLVKKGSAVDWFKGWVCPGGFQTMNREFQSSTALSALLSAAGLTSAFG
jgi:hypothetical protein